MCRNHMFRPPSATFLASLGSVLAIPLQKHTGAPLHQETFVQYEGLHKNYLKNVTGDGTWNHHSYSDEDTMRWNPYALHRSTTPLVFLTQLSAGKTTATAFSDFRGTLFAGCVPHKTTYSPYLHCCSSTYEAGHQV